MPAIGPQERAYRHQLPSRRQHFPNRRDGRAERQLSTIARRYGEPILGLLTLLLWVLVFLPLYTGAFDPQRLRHQVRRTAPWIRWSTLVLVLMTWKMAASLGVSHAGLAAWLALCGASGAFRVLWFKPALDRAAFPEPH